jgi:hypothetical protein
MLYYKYRLQIIPLVLFKVSRYLDNYITNELVLPGYLL